MNTPEQIAVLRSLEVPYGQVFDYEACLRCLTSLDLTGFCENHPNQGAVLVGIFQEIQAPRLFEFFSSLGLPPKKIHFLYEQALAFGAPINKTLEAQLEELT